MSDITKTESPFIAYIIPLPLSNIIRVTNTPVNIIIPNFINIPSGECSELYYIELPNQPLFDILITYSYDNSVYNESNFWPNHQTAQ